VQFLLTEFLMQPDATSGTAQPGAAHDAPSEGVGGPVFGLQQAGMIAVMFALFYFLMLRPQQKKQRETDDMLKALKRGDVVRTSGGIRGEVADLTESDVVLIVADKVKINVLRSHIANKVATDAKEKP
jgi:preprotein translocase subunit YajC